MPVRTPQVFKNAIGFAVGALLGFLPIFYFVHPTQPVRNHPQAFDYNAPPHLRDKQVFRIVAFGSSSTQGIGASTVGNSYPARLERLFKAYPGRRKAVEVVNRGIGNEDIEDMLKRLQSDILSRKPDLVIWQAGSNDALFHVPLDQFKEDLRAGIAEFRASGVELMVMEPQWCPEIELAEPTNRYLEAMHLVLREQNVAIIPRFELMQQWIASGLISEKDLIGPDHLHMTDRGYELLAQAVFDEVVQRSEAFGKGVLLRASLP